MPRRKSLKVIVDIEFHAVTCPGVFLPDREDVFINIDIFGQLKRTKLHPPVFPFLFHEKIRFEKVFLRAIDPIQIAEELCGESVQIELVQLSYPAGEKLGVFVDNAREFLFPTPKVTPSYPGVDRELLFERSPSFPGISPKLEFSSRTTIKEVASMGRSQSEKEDRDRPKSYSASNEHRSTKSRSRSEKSLPKSPQKCKPRKKSLTKSQSLDGRGRGNRRSRSANRGCTMYGYEQPTIASRARSPSPYARRRMAELSIKDPFESATRAKPFKSEIDKKPEFVVRKVLEDTLSLDRTPPPPKSPRQSTTPTQSYKSPYDSPSGGRSAYRLPLGISSDDNSDIHTSMKAGSPTSGLPSPKSDSPSRLRESKFSVNDLDDGIGYSRPTLQERLASHSSPYEKIRDRVRALLQSPRATRIADDAKRKGEEQYWRRRSRSPSPRSPRYY